MVGEFFHHVTRFRQVATGR
jgi:hypothetical protein